MKRMKPIHPGGKLLTRAEVVLEISLDCGGRRFRSIKSLFFRTPRSFWTVRSWSHPRVGEGNVTTSGRFVVGRRGRAAHGEKVSAD